MKLIKQFTIKDYFVNIWGCVFKTAINMSKPKICVKETRLPTGNIV